MPISMLKENVLKKDQEKKCDPQAQKAHPQQKHLNKQAKLQNLLKNLGDCV